MKPCLQCGEPSTDSRCTTHQLPKKGRRHDTHLNKTRWKKLSRKLRSIQPWCSTCGATDDLTVDHRKPIATHPELAYALDNLDVLCRSCNGAKDAHLGGHPKSPGQPPRGKAQTRMNVTMDVVT